MTDRELLELAAKAAGLSLEQGPGSPPEKCLGACWDGDTWDYWNPLDDDCDALRLAVKLFFTVGVEHGFTEVLTLNGREITESHNDDALSATRRAIVRAAAAIGRRR